MRYASITERLSTLGSGKWAVHIEARAMAAAGKDIIELTIGEPDVAPDQALLEECTRAMHAGRTRYSNGRGEPAVVKALAEKYRKRRAGVTENNILCFPGTQTALFAVMLGLVEAGDAVLVGDPLYATYEGVVASTGARLVPVPLSPGNRFHLRAEDLEKAITPECRVLLLNSPHNPTGAVLTADEIAAIGEVCRRHDLWIVSDEVYEELIFERGLCLALRQSRSVGPHHRCLVDFEIPCRPGFPQRLGGRSGSVLRACPAGVRDHAVRRPALHLGHDGHGRLAAFLDLGGDAGKLPAPRPHPRKRACR